LGKKYRQTNGGLNPGTNSTKGQTISTQTHQQHFSTLKTECNPGMLGGMLIPPAMMEATAWLYI